MKTLDIYLQDKKYRIVSHLLFWLVAFAFLIGFYGRINKDYSITLSFVAMLFPIAIACTYFFIYYLFPKYLIKKRYTRFIIFSIYTIIVSIWAQMLVLSLTFITIGNYNTKQINPYSFDSITLLVGIYFIVIIASVIKLLRYSFEQQRKNRILLQKQYDTEINLNKAKLELLKAQLHPHFLFNTLNNIYGLTLEKSNDAPELVMRFSELLDYILHKTKDDRVTLEDEITYIKNFADIERFRFGNKLIFNFDCIGTTKNIYLSPMILLPFIENAFKYGINPINERSYINIKIKVSEDELFFNIINDINKEFASKKKSNGIGLKNIKKRLDLIYHNKHSLVINESKEKFEVTLNLKLN